MEPQAAASAAIASRLQKERAVAPPHAPLKVAAQTVGVGVVRG